MLVVRLQRTGRKNIPAYRIVVAEKNAPIKGKVKEYVGHYLPARNPHVFEFNKERIEYWISKGAQPTDTMARLLSREGVQGLEKFTKKYTKKKKRKEVPEEEKTAAAPAADAAPASDAPPAEEKPAEEAPRPTDDSSGRAKEEAPKEEAKKEEAPKEETPKEGKKASEEAPKEGDTDENKE